MYNKLFGEVGSIKVGRTVQQDEFEINLDRPLVTNPARIRIMETIMHFNQGKKIIINPNGLEIPNDLKELFTQRGAEIRSAEFRPK